MYRDTMYILTITSWLHSQWQSYIATKKSHCEFDPHQNTSVLSAEHRTKIILSTEHQYKKLLWYTKNKEKLWKETNSETIFHSNRSHSLWHSSLLKPKSRNNKFNLILDIFTKNWCYPNCNSALQTVFWSQTITVIVPLQKFRE